MAALELRWTARCEVCAAASECLATDESHRGGAAVVLRFDLPWCKACGRYMRLDTLGVAKGERVRAEVGVLEERP